MALASGADINIGGTDLFIDETQPDHYDHQFIDAQTFFSTQEAGPGVQHANLFHNVRYWYGANYEQGEGFQNWGTAPDNDGYDQSTANTRIPGQLRPRPTRQDSSITSPGVPPDFIHSVVANGKIVISAYQSNITGAVQAPLFVSPDGTTWTTLGTSKFWGSLCSDGTNVYGMQGETGTVWRIGPTGTTTQVTQGITAPAVFFAGNSLVVTALGSVFEFNGSELYAFDITSTTDWPYAQAEKYRVPLLTGDPSTAPAVVGTAGINVDNTVVLMAAYDSNTSVYQVTSTQPGIWSGSKLWQLPLGFTGRDICFSGGVLFCVGEYENRAAVFALSLQGNQDTFVGYVRPWAEGYIAQCGVGPGSQILLTHSSQGYFVYDYQQDAFSYLGSHYADGTNSADIGRRSLTGRTYVGNESTILTFQGNRVAIQPNEAMDTVYATKFQHDLTMGTAADTDTQVVFPTWDFGFVSGNKTLLGFEFRTLELASGDSIAVEYLLDDAGIYKTFPSDPADGSWTTFANMDFVDDGNATSKYVDLTDLDLKFRRIKLRFTLVGQPVLTGWSFKVHVPPGQELFKLIVRLRDETSTNTDSSAITSPTNRQAAGSDIASFLWSYIRSKTPVAFQDGYFYSRSKPNFDEYTVVIEMDPDQGHTVTDNGQGYMKLSLRRVDENSLS